MQIAKGQQSLTFKHITVEEGLSSGSVLSITQDKQGFLWIGTMDGLNRYDGNKVKIYKSFYADNPIGASLKFNQLLTDSYQNLWIGTNNGLYLYDYRLDSFRVFYHSASDKKSISHNNIKALYMDRSGAVWVGTQNGLNKIKSYEFEHIPLAPTEDGSAIYDITAIFETNAGTMLIGTNDGIIGLKKQTNGFSTDKICLEGEKISAITQDRNNIIWVGSAESGLFKLDKDLALIKNYTHQNRQETGLVNNTIRKILTDNKGRLWIGTLKGLSLLNPVTEHFENYVHRSDDETTLNFNSIYDIYKDRQGNIWVGTFFGGLNVAEAISTPFKVFKNEERNDWINSNVISSIVNGHGNDLWIGTEAEGVYYYNRNSQTFRSIKNDETRQPVLSSNLVKALLVDHENNLWVGMHNGGVNILNSTGKRIGQFRKNSSANSINSDNVFCLMQDSRKRVWIGFQEEGINIYDPQAKSMQTFANTYPGKKLTNNGITCLFEDSKKNTWIGTGKGLNMLDSSGKKLESFNKIDYPNQLESDFIICIAEDELGMIWIGTYQGLSVFDPSKKTIKTFTTADGLAGNKVLGVVTDQYNNLWVSTNNGLSRMNLASKRFQSFNAQDGLPGSVFNYRSYFKDRQGHLYFGSYKGFVEFAPEEIEINPMPPAVVLTGIMVNGETLPKSKKDSGNLSATKTITLKYDQNFLVVDYAVMNFIKPQKNKSAYKLEGFNDNWTYTSIPVATFTNLPAGNYKLHIKACNNDDVWNANPYTLRITILPPPWKSWWAYTLYLLAIALLALGIIFYFSSRIAMRRKLSYQRKLNEKQQELHQMKMDFFTHISHELRTPLTLIMGPVEMLKSLVPAKSTAEKLTNTIQNNAERLLKLTNDLLDFRKADAGYTQLKIKKENIVSFTRCVFEKFTTAAFEKNVSFQFRSETENRNIYFDAAHMEIVLSNLLSNAIKFTAPGGSIVVSIVPMNHDFVEISVCDNGVGIPRESQEKIFTQFYQADAGGIKHNGSGIGLAFSKSLVELHGGSLHFRSDIDTTTGKKETCFTVTLICGKKHFNDNTLIID